MVVRTVQNNNSKPSFPQGPIIDLSKGSNQMWRYGIHSTLKKYIRVEKIARTLMNSTRHLFLDN